MAEKQKGYFSSREAAKLLGVAVSTVQLWVDSGELKAWTTTGGHRRIARMSVENMLKHQRQALGCEDPGQDNDLKVVIVEDEASQQRLYQKLFKSWDIKANITTAKDGYDGLFKIGHSVPNIIITDLHMPTMDGFQMIRMLNEQRMLDPCSIIVITGLSTSEINERGGLPKGTHLLTKPIEASELEALVRQAIPQI
jgi:excisionase family DNA binding protein